MAFQGKGRTGQRLGVKIFDGQFVKAGNIIVRQRGLNYIPVKNVEAGKDYTIFALKDGYVLFHGKKRISVLDTKDEWSSLKAKPDATKPKVKSKSTVK